MLNQRTHLEYLLTSQWKKCTYHLFAHKERATRWSITSQNLYFCGQTCCSGRLHLGFISHQSCTLFLSWPITSFLACVSSSLQYKSVASMPCKCYKQLVEKWFCGQPNKSSDILHLRSLVTATNEFDCGIICQWFHTGFLFGRPFMTNSIKQHREDLKAPWTHASYRATSFGRPKVLKETTDILDNFSLVLKLFTLDMFFAIKPCFVM